MTLQTIAPPMVVRQFHDDWLLWNVYADGSVREFNTEGWTEHGNDQNWPKVYRAARVAEFAAVSDMRYCGRLSRFQLDIPEADGTLSIPEFDAAMFFRLFNEWFVSLGDWPSDAQLYETDSLCAEAAPSD